ncbi:MAG TPA: NADH:flavin oxidoreductase, partial [Syntrophomonas sp.]|nr:NADH:flavin oxidoreductase [Syntrophomonas sp.]
MKYEKIFLPIRIGNMELKNRLVVPPMATNYCNPDYSVSERAIAYYGKRAQGGFGLITLEGTVVDPLGRATARMSCIYDDTFIPGLKRLADEVHKWGAKLSVQIHHAGRQTSSATMGGQPVSASKIKCPFIKEVPRELTTEEAYQVIEQFGDAALRARKAGVDCVEIHGAHGYLISQFMSAYS